MTTVKTAPVKLFRTKFRQQLPLIDSDGAQIVLFRKRKNWIVGILFPDCTFNEKKRFGSEDEASEFFHDFHTDSLKGYEVDGD